MMLSLLRTRVQIAQVAPSKAAISMSSIRTFRSLLPKRLILVRHGESLGNKNEEAYESTPDHHIPLTKKGKEQAHELGYRLRALIKNEPLLIYCSPYKRTKQTLLYIMRSFTDSPIHDCREEPRLAGTSVHDLQSICQLQHIITLLIACHLSLLTLMYVHLPDTTYCRTTIWEFSKK
jgi:phosphohistidine phosphatase SixA